MEEKKYLEVFKKKKTNNKQATKKTPLKPIKPTKPKP